MTKAPTFCIRNVPVFGDLVLAPMSGYNDQPFRLLCQEYGAALTYTGLLAANSILYGSQKYGNRRTNEMLRLHVDEHPLVCQLFGSDVAILKKAAQKILPLHMDVMDINMGCAKYKVTRSGAGSALLRDPLKVGEIIDQLSQVLPIPVTAKIRLGLDEEDRKNRSYLRIAYILQDNGAAMIAVHGRTAGQGFSGAADWDAIAEIKQVLSIPVLASGDVTSTDDIVRIKQYTGCDGVMIGRAALGNPWIFQHLNRGDISWVERKTVILKHLDKSLVFHGSKHGLHRFRKHLRGYLRQSGLPKWYRSQMLACECPDLLIDMLNTSDEYL